MSGVTLIILMFVMVFLGVPVVFALALSSLSFFLINGVPLSTFVTKLSVSVNSFSLLALPFFILAGNLMNTGGITKRLFRFANDLLGWLKGGLCYVSIVSNMIFSALSGSSLANAAGLGTLIIKAMEDEGYDKEFSMCLTATASVLGPIIPPSVIMIVYGVTAGVSINKMFMGGIVPGILYGIMLAVLCNILNKRSGHKYFPATKKRASGKDIWKSFLKAFPALLTPVIILGGVFSGIFTATESGAIACAYAAIIGLFVYKDMKIKDIFNVILNAGKTTGSILMISAAAGAFGFCLAFDRLPQKLANTLITVISSKVVLLLIFMVVYLFLGCIMSGSAIVITTVPIFLPLCNAMGIDLVYFGVFVGVLMAIGTTTPPVGTVMFVLCRNTGVSIDRYAKVMIPWFLMILLFCLLLAFFPQLITTLPGRM